MAEIFDNEKYKKYATDKIKSSQSEVFNKSDVLRNFAKFTGKCMCESFFVTKVASLRPANLLKKRLSHRCFQGFCEVYKSTFFQRAPLAATTVKYNFLLK